MKTYVVVHSKNSSLSPNVITYFVKSESNITGFFGDLEDIHGLDWVNKIYDKTRELVKFLEIKYDNGCDTLGIDVLPEEKEIKIFNL